MANATLKVTTPVITGVAYTAASGTIVSSETVTISATTAQSALDFSSLIVVCTNASSTASLTLSIGVGTEYSSIGQGAASVTVGTAATVIIGGQGFESARFLTSADTLVITQAGAGPGTYVASQSPRATE